MQMWGQVPVPWTVSWTAEETDWRLEIDPYAKRLAICQASAPGQGKPKFGTPHAQRQRKAIAECLCDLCGRSLKASTKVSLSHARSRANSFRGGEILQVEPMLHRECAAKSMAQCPSLKRDIQAGTLMVRQVTSFSVQFALMDAEYVETIVGTPTIAVGHAKVQLRSWRDRDGAWLLE